MTVFRGCYYLLFSSFLYCYYLLVSSFLYCYAMGLQCLGACVFSRFLIILRTVSRIACSLRIGALCPHYHNLRHNKLCEAIIELNTMWEWNEVKGINCLSQQFHSFYLLSLINLVSLSNINLKSIHRLTLLNFINIIKINKQDQPNIFFWNLKFFERIANFVLRILFTLKSWILSYHFNCFKSRILSWSFQELKSIIFVKFQVICNNIEQNYQNYMT